MTRDRRLDAVWVHLADVRSGGFYWTRFGAAEWDRYLRSTDLSVLDQAIAALQRAAAATPPAHPTAAVGWPSSARR